GFNNYAPRKALRLIYGAINPMTHQ
ncbi:unnamed protein product, partial [Allacma fusca]